MHWMEQAASKENMTTELTLRRLAVPGSWIGDKGLVIKCPTFSGSFYVRKREVVTRKLHTRHGSTRMHRD